MNLTWTHVLFLHFSLLIFYGLFDRQENRKLFYRVLIELYKRM